MLCVVLFIVTGLMDLSMETLKNQEWTEVSWRNNGYNAKFSAKTHSDHGYFVIVTGLMGISMEALKRQEWTEVSWRNNGYNAKFIVKTRSEHGLAIEYTYFH